MTDDIEGQMSIFDFPEYLPKPNKKDIRPKMKPVEEVKEWQYSEDNLNLDNLRPCDCGYTGRKAVAYVGCGTPNNGYLNGTPTFDHYLFSIFCPECYRTATANLGWKSNKTDKQEAMRDWQNNPLRESTIKGTKWFEKFVEKMDETIERFDGFVERSEEK